MAVKIFQCLYCPRGIGEISVDLDVVRNGPPYAPYRPPKGPEGDCADENFLVFDADNPAGTICRHVINYSLSVTIYRPARRPGKDDVRVFQCNDWSHPWFRVHDADGEVHRHLLVEVCGGDDLAFHPRSPHWLGDVYRVRKVPDSRLRASIMGSVLVAMEPENFLVELRDAHARMVDFYTKRGPGNPT